MEISAPMMAAYADELESDGWNVQRLEVPDPNPAALIAAALPAVTTKYTFRLDSDTLVGDDIVLEATSDDDEIELTFDDVKEADQIGPGVYRLRSGAVICFLNSATVH